MAAVGLSEIPVGVKFEPTDEELIEDYLLPKVKDCYADYGVVTYADVFGLDPRLLRPLAQYDPGDGNLYFFASRTRSTPNGTRAKRTKDKCGWVFTDRPVEITNKYEQPIGERRLFVYKIGGKNTSYRLHEYRLCGLYELPSSSSGGKGSLYLDLVLCRVWLKPADKKETQAYNPVAATKQPYQPHFADLLPPSSYCPQEENQQSTEVPITANKYYTTLLQSSHHVFPTDEELAELDRASCGRII